MAAAGLLAIAGFVRGADPQPWLDRLIIVEVALAAAAVLSGLVKLSRGKPTDPLHLLYGVVLLTVIAGGRYLGRRRGRRQTAWVAASSVVALGVIVRLAMTG